MQVTPKQDMRDRHGAQSGLELSDAGLEGQDSSKAQPRASLALTGTYYHQPKKAGKTTWRVLPARLWREDRGSQL